ncbi:MAG: arginyltransferase [Pseudomonadota bacterium]
MTRPDGRSLDSPLASSGGQERARPLAFFFGTRGQTCPYLPNRMEMKIVTDLSGPFAQDIHDELTAAGFRRSHNLVYKPACLGCNACVPVRIPVARFSPGRTMRKTWRRNDDLKATIVSATATLEQYDVFDRYQKQRHHDGGMATMTFADYRAMVEETPVRTRLIEFRTSENDLVGVCLTDWINDGLSGIYKFFDPDLAERSLGTYMILWQINHAAAHGMPFVYLGYWIAGCDKMSYKARFRPLEALTATGWQDLQTD